VIPKAWQVALGGPVLNGQCCLPVISRTSWGPAAFAIDPEKIGPGVVPAVPLVYYPQAHPLGAYDAQGALFNAATQVNGVVFPEGTRSVLFFGRQGLGPYCYGEARDCGDQGETSKGPHLFPYTSYVWAYDANDLAAVKRGERQPWEVKPYATWPLAFQSQRYNARIGGATYDPSTGRIFVSGYQGDGDGPLIHVYTVKR